MSAATDETVNVNPDTETEEEEIPTTVNESGKAAIVKEREARKAAAKEARELKAELDALKADKAAADEAKRLADEKAAEEQGQFKELAEKRATELAAANAEKQTAQEKLDTLIAAIRPDVETAWKDIPDEIKSFYDGADDDVLAKRAFLAKSKPALDKLTAQQNEANDRFRKVPTTRRPNGKEGNIDEEARKSQASMYRSF